MASQCGQCTKQLKHFNNEMSSQEVSARDPAAIVSLRSFNPMADCVERAGKGLGVEIGDMLNAVEASGVEQALPAWQQAVLGIVPAKRQIQRIFMPGARPAKANEEMSVEEFRGCQV